MAKIICTILVCIDCMLVHCNGETGELPEGHPEPLNLIEAGYSVTGPDGDSEGYGFSWSSCEGCGSNLGGDRYEMTLWED